MKYAALAVLLLVTVQPPPTPTPDLERTETEVHRLLQLGITTRAQCLTAFGHARFCECLALHLPLAVEFKHYVEVVIVTPAGDQYKALSQEWKDVVDATHAARDQCVATLTP